MSRLEGKVAVVTGAGRGIGRAIALALAAEGADVVCVSRTEQNAQTVAAEVAALGRRSAAFGVDVADPTAVEAAIDETLKGFDRVDILINNAGITRDGLLMRMKDDDWSAVLDTNLRGAFNCIRAVTRAMMKQRSGRIINISSVVGLAGNAGQANYAASKAGLIGLTKSVAKELGSRGITCNAVAPGFIETDMTADLSAEMQAKIKENCALGRLGSSEDVANAVLFLCTEEAGYITGQTLAVDGGLAL